MTKIDLHIHSTYSNDGEFSPAQLVALSLEAGLTHAAIADHNSVRAIREAAEAADGTTLRIIPAIEMDCLINGTNLHVLGYGIDSSAPIFYEIEAELHQQDQENSAQLLHRVRQLGIDFDDDLIENLAYDGVVTGEMIAEASLIYDSEEKNPLLDPYRGDGARSDNPYVNFYWDYCSQGKPAYVHSDFISLAQAIDIIQSNHGVPVLAHPGINVKENLTMLNEILSAGILGIEVYSSYHNQQQVEFYKAVALSNHLLMTCGSDFHGKTKKNIKIGGTCCENRDDQIITNLIEKMGKFINH